MAEMVYRPWGALASRRLHLRCSCVRVAHAMAEAASEKYDMTQYGRRDASGPRAAVSIIAVTAICQKPTRF